MKRFSLDLLRAVKKKGCALEVVVCVCEGMGVEFVVLFKRLL